MAFSSLQRSRSSPGFASNEGPWSLKRRTGSSAANLQPQPLSLKASLSRGTQRRDRLNWKQAPILAGPGAIQPTSPWSQNPKKLETMFATGAIRPQLSSSSASKTETVFATVHVVRPQSQGSIRPNKPETMVATLQLHHPRTPGCSRSDEPEVMFTTGLIRPQSQGSVRPKKLYHVGQSRSTHKVRQALGTLDDSARLRRFEHLLQDHSVCCNKRLAPHVATMEKEVDELASVEDFKREVQLDKDASEAEKMAMSMDYYKDFLTRKAEDDKCEAATRIQKIVRGKKTRQSITTLQAAGGPVGSN